MIAKLQLTSKSIPFVLLNLVILTSPLFFASNHPVFWLTIEVVVAISFAIFAASVFFTKCDISFAPYSRNKHYFLLAAFLVLLTVFQLLPIPMLAHSVWLQTENVLNYNAWQSISSNRYQTLDGLGRWLTYAFVFYLVLCFARNTKRANQLLHAILLTILICSVYGLITYAFDIEKILWYDKKAYIDVVTGTFINRNSFASYTAIGLIISLTYFFKNIFRNTQHLRGKTLLNALLGNAGIRSVFYFSTSVILFYTITLTQSRAGLASATLGVFVILVSMFFKRKHIRSYILVIGFSIFFILTIIFLLQVDAFQQRMEHLAKYGEMRDDFYYVAFEVIKDYPWFGTGLGTFSDNFSLYKNNTFPFWFTKTVQNAHSTYLEILLEMGFFALTGCLIIQTLIAYRLIRGISCRKRDSDFSVIAFATFATMSAHSLIDFPLEMPAVSVTFAAIMAIGLAQSSSSRVKLLVNMSNAQKCDRRALLLTSCIACVVLIYAVSQLPIAYQLYRQKLFFEQTTDANDSPTYEEFTQIIQSQLSILYHTRHPELESALVANQIKLLGRFQMKISPSEDLKLRKSIYDRSILSLKNAPINYYLWYVIAYMPCIRTTCDYELAANALYESSKINSHRLTLFNERMRLVKKYWQYSSPEARKFYIDELKNIWLSNKWARGKVVESLGHSGHYILEQAFHNDPKQLSELLKVKSWIYRDKDK